MILLTNYAYLDDMKLVTKCPSATFGQCLFSFVEEMSKLQSVLCFFFTPLSVILVVGLVFKSVP